MHPACLRDIRDYVDAARSPEEERPSEPARAA
jgi:hypothetical protein